MRLRSIAPLFVKALILAVTVANLGSCSSVSYQVRTGTVRTSTLHEMENLNMDRAAPILIRIYKEERTLEVWKQDQTGKFASPQIISDLQSFGETRTEDCPR